MKRENNFINEFNLKSNDETENVTVYERTDIARASLECKLVYVLNLLKNGCSQIVY